MHAAAAVSPNPTETMAAMPLILLVEVWPKDAMSGCSGVVVTVIRASMGAPLPDCTDSAAVEMSEIMAAILARTRSGLESTTCTDRTGRSKTWDHCPPRSARLTELPCRTPIPYSVAVGEERCADSELPLTVRSTTAAKEMRDSENPLYTPATVGAPGASKTTLVWAKYTRSLLLKTNTAATVKNGTNNNYVPAALKTPYQLNDGHSKDAPVLSRDFRRRALIGGIRAPASEWVTSREA